MTIRASRPGGSINVLLTRKQESSELSHIKPRVIFFWVMAALVLASSGWVHWKFGVNGIGIFGSYASVFGLIVTFYVAESVRSVRSRYTVRVTLMQTFERFSAAVRDFDEATKAVEIQPLAGRLVPLVQELSVHLSTDESVESLLTSLRDLMNCEIRSARFMKAKVHTKLRSFQSQVEIQRNKDEWRRDDA